MGDPRHICHRRARCDSHCRLRCRRRNGTGPAYGGGRGEAGESRCAHRPDLGEARPRLASPGTAERRQARARADATGVVSDDAVVRACDRSARRGARAAGDHAAATAAVGCSRLRACAKRADAHALGKGTLAESCVAGRGRHSPCNYEAWLFCFPPSRGSMSTLKLASMVAAFGAIATVSACNKGSENTTKGVDTTVTSTRVRDTTVVKSDTTVHTDTVKKTTHVPDAKKP